MTIGTGVATEKTADELVGRLFEATLGMMDILSVYLGDRLGLYRALRDGGPTTAGDLATRAGIDPRYALEWLEQQAVTGFLEVDDVSAAVDERRYGCRMPTRSLLNPTARTRSPACSVVGGVRAGHAGLLDAFRSGGGVAWLTTART
jgi:hypothetical protein